MVPLEPKITLRALLPNGPLALASLIVAMAKVPTATVSCPLNVLVLLNVRVPAPVLVRPPVLEIIPLKVVFPEPVTVRT